MNQQEARQCAEALWRAHMEEVRADAVRRAETEECRMRFGDVCMRYEMQTIGQAGPNGYPVYIALHGGGGCPEPGMNDRQWAHMRVYYRDSVRSGLYINPRGVRDTWDTHANPESYPLYDRLIENLIAFCHADANRVYLLGFSAGGDGVYLVGPRMADRFAALHMSAGHPNKGSMVNLYHTPIQLQVGLHDNAYDRAWETVRYHLYLNDLQNAQPDGYIHNTYVHVDKPHNFRDNADAPQIVLIDPRAWLYGGAVTRRSVDTNAVRFLDEFVRDPVPRRVIWELDTRGEEHAPMRSVESFYWLHVPGEVKAGTVIARLEPAGNALIIERDDTGGRASALLRDGMLDLDSPIRLVFPNGREEIRTVRREQAVLKQTMCERGDRNYMFSACLPLC